MATMSRAEPKHMYSWWWASHMSPKNSKWLQENLTDMDSKVKLMIKLIEVDEDSFARRAEMYYKKRPELMKLVEEFYRAYRALAERYDHATGVIRHAHKTMADAFPNQVPILESVDGSFGPSKGSDPRTPEMSDLVQAFWTPGELENGDAGLTPSGFHSAERNGPFWSREASFSKIAEGRVRKALNFHDAKIKVHTQKTHGLSECDRLERSETDIKALKEALAKLEDEKEAGMLQYQQCVQRLSNLESEVLRAQGDSKGFHERASKAEAEVWSLKESLGKLEGEREASLCQYQQCLNRISSLESYVSHSQEGAEKRAYEAEKEAWVLREDLAQLKNEKEAGLVKYMEALENIANLENKLLLAEDKASLASERADHAEKEVVALKEALARITEEKEAAALQYQQCLETIASLENEISLSHEAAARLKDEMDQGTAKLKGAEEQCQLLESSTKAMKTELDSVLFKLEIQNEELSEKQDEVGRLWSCIQEERVRVVEAETAFRTLQDLHSRTQEELRSGAAELQKRVQLLKDMDVHSQTLQGELQKIRDENKSLNELNASSAVSIKNMDDEILNLKDGKEKLKEELELQLDQRSSLQQELFCLKEELNVLEEKHRAMLEQVESVGFEPECFVSSVTDLKEENSKLKETCQSSEAEITALLEKLGAMEKLIEKNAVLEHSLVELSVELEDAREKVKAMEESCQLLMNEKSIVLDEKASLIFQLDITTENLERLSERNTFLKHSLFDANAELEALRAKSRNLEESCKLLDDEKSILVNDRQALELKLETAHQRLKELGGKHADLEKSYNSMEEERVSVVRLVEDLHNSLAAEKQEHYSSTQLSRIQMIEMKRKICVLQVLVDQTRGQLGEELDKAANAQFEIFILRSTLQDLKETNCLLLKDCEKLSEASTLSEKLISELKHESTEQKEEVSFLIDQITSLRLGMFQLLKVLQVDLNLVSEDDLEADQMVLHHILVKLDDTRRSLSRAWDENEKLVIEKSVLVTLLGRLKQEVADLKTLIDSLQQEFSKRNDHLSSLQGDMLKLLQSNEKLLLRVREGNHKEELLASEMGSLREKFREMQGVCKDLEKENSRILEENRSLSKAVIDLDDEKHNIELENSRLFVETVTLDTLSLIFKNSILERSMVTSHLIDDMYKLFGENRALEDKVRIMDAMLGEYQTENMSLKASLKKYVDELKQVKAKKCQLEDEIANARDLISHKEMELLQAEALNDDQGKEIHELSERCDQRIKESEFLRESMHNLETEIGRMQVEHKETDIMVESLRSDLKRAEDEAGLWETVAGTTFIELQTSSVCEALYIEKLFELARVYQCLVDRNNSDGLKALQLKERIESLESENSQMKAQWIEYVPAMSTLRDAVASLERQVMRTEADNVHDEEEEPGDEHHHSVIKQPNQTPDPQEAEVELAMKDIMLDQASESSSHRNNSNIWYNSAESDDQIVELWEAVDKAGNIHQPEAVNHYSEIPAEKELRVDSLELSKRYTELSEAESNEKLLERLSSDAQKLTNLQITVHDLKQKVAMITENSNTTKGKEAEYSGVKDQLEEAGRAIAKLIDANSKLVNHTEDRSTDTPLWPTSSPISDPSETGESERMRRKVSEQARRCTDKIGRLQVEVQKIQFLLLKLDSGSIIGRSSTTRTVEHERKVPLRVYFYGAGACAPRRRRTARFCACLKPPTSGE